MVIDLCSRMCVRERERQLGNGNKVPTNRLFQMIPCQFDVFCVGHEHLAHLQMCARLDLQRWLKRKQRLQALDAFFDVWRICCAKIFGQAEQRNVAGILTGLTGCHFNIRYSHKCDAHERKSNSPVQWCVYTVHVWFDYYYLLIIYTFIIDFVYVHSTVCKCERYKRRRRQFTKLHFSLSVSEALPL